MGYIYILTNPSFPEYVKIGYADDVKSRVSQLNNTECTPFAFRIYATYEVGTQLADKKIHRLIDKLNPNLRSVDNIDDKPRVREFYAMSKEDAYSLLKEIAEIHGLEKNLQLWVNEQPLQTGDPEPQGKKQNHRPPFTFTACNIAIGEEVEFSHRDNPHNGETFKVIDDKHVAYNGQSWALTTLAKHFINPNVTDGPCYFKYHGQRLHIIRKNLEQGISDTPLPSPAHRPPFTFSLCNISIGEEVEFTHGNNPHNGEMFRVIDDKHVAYNGQPWALTTLAKHFINPNITQGSYYFRYKGKRLTEIREELGK